MRIGFIGAGNFANCHGDSVRRIGATVVGCHDTNRASAEAFVAKHGGRVFASPEEMVKPDLIDCLYVIIPPFARDGRHEKLALERGVPFLCEKPLGLKLDHARQVSREIERRGVVSACGFLLRYGETATRIRQMLAGKRLSAARSSRLDTARAPYGWWTWREEQSGGWMMEWGVHTLDFMRFTLGEVDSVCAFRADGILDARHPQHKIYDSIATILRFKSGLVADLLVSGVCPIPAADLDFLDVHGDNFRLHYENIWENCRVRYRTTENDWTEWRVESLDLRHDLKNRAFLTAVEKRDPSLVLDSYPDALKTTALALAINASAQTGRIINVDAYTEQA